MNELIELVHVKKGMLVLYYVLG